MSFVAPSWVHTFYSKFPLVTLEQEDKLSWSGLDGRILWIVPSTSQTRPWASSNPDCLRAQLLSKLRRLDVTFRDWPEASNAPGGSLPALHLTAENRLLPSDQIRNWIDQESPLDDLNGMPDQDSYDRAVATAQLILNRIRPVSSMDPLDHSIPPPLSAGLVTPLPASMTGDSRIADREEIRSKAGEAWEAVEAIVKDGWALGAKRPTPLDALIAAYAFTQDAGDRSAGLKDYVDRLLDYTE